MVAMTANPAYIYIYIYPILARMVSSNYGMVNSTSHVATTFTVLENAIVFLSEWTCADFRGDDICNGYSSPGEEKR